MRRKSCLTMATGGQMDGQMDRRTDTHTYLPTSSVPFSLFQLHCLLNSLQEHLGTCGVLCLHPCSNTFSQSALSSPSLCSNVTCAGYTPGLESMLASSYSLTGHFILLAHLPVLHSTRRFHQGRASAHVPAAVPLTPCPWQVLIILLNSRTDGGWGTLQRWLSG